MSIRAKSFILNKVYPNSPKIGTKVFKYKTASNVTTGYISASDTINPHTKIFDVGEIEGYPDFWKEIKHQL